MPDFLQQFAGSLLAVIVLVLIAARLGFRDQPRLRNAEHAREIARVALGGIEPAKVGLDRQGHAALLRTATGRFCLLSPHGAHFVCKDLGGNVRAQAHEQFLTVRCADGKARGFVLDLGDSAAEWAAAIAASG
jgi:hypothetical protein